MGSFVESFITSLTPSEQVDLLELSGSPGSFQPFLNNVKVVITQVSTMSGQTAGRFNQRVWATVDTPGRWQVIYDEYITNPNARKMHPNEKIRRADGSQLIIVFTFDNAVKGQILYCNDDLAAF